MSETTPAPVPRSLWAVGIVALIWNLIGIVTFLMQFTIRPEYLAELPEAEQALYLDIPWWATAAYAIAVATGVLGSIALLLRKAWAVPVFAVSLVAIVVQMSHALFLTDLMAVRGAASALMPVLLILIAAFLVWYAQMARQRGWLG